MRERKKQKLSHPDFSSSDEEFIEAQDDDALPFQRRRKENHVPKRNKVLVDLGTKESDPTSPFYYIHKFRNAPDSKEFVYLSRGKGTRAKPANPYELVVVKHSRIDKNDYFTISSMGITHYCNGDISITALDDWVREYGLYFQLLTIPLFSQHRMWKSYTVWRKNVRSRKIAESKKELEQALFILHPIIRSGLLQISEIADRLAILNLFLIDHRRTYALEDFEEVQDAQRLHISNIMRNIFEDACDMLCACCEQVVIGAGFSVDEEDDRKKDGGYNYTRKAAKRAICSRLAAFVKLADCVAMSALHRCALAALEGLLDELRSRAEENNRLIHLPADEVPVDEDMVDVKTKRVAEPRAIFITHCILRDQKLQFSPPEQEFASVLDKNIENMVGQLNSFEKFIFVEELQPFITGGLDALNESSSELEVQEIIRGDPFYQEVVEEIRYEFLEQFKQMKIASRAYQPFADVFLENLTFDIEVVAEEEPPLEFFKEEMEKYRRQREAIHAMRLSMVVGILILDADSLQKLFMPEAVRCLQDLEGTEYGRDSLAPKYSSLSRVT